MSNSGDKNPSVEKPISMIPDWRKDGLIIFTYLHPEEQSGAYVINEDCTNRKLIKGNVNTLR